MPISSLPSPYGIGTLGKSAYQFVDFLKKSGQKYWQVLPLGPTSYGDSPYQALSSFAGNPYFIDLDLLIKDGLLKEEDLKDAWWYDRPDTVNYGSVYYYRYPVLRKAFAAADRKLKESIAEFRKENAAWLENYALYMAVKNNEGMKNWISWEDEDLRLHKEAAVRKYHELYKEEVDFWVFLQYEFYKQWNSLRDYAHKNGIKFIGDVPIYVAFDSADVWSEPKYFQLDDRNLPKKVSGVPPDAFTEDGQLWGNPLYDWDEMKKDGYGWWIRRIEGAGKLFDMIRIDHFRGFESYWAVPYGDKTAKNGAWVPGPGMDFVRVLRDWFCNIDFIAEDLGVITPEVAKLLKDSGFPGMKVLAFAFDSGSSNLYLPHNCTENSICYVGTHDNDTIKGWKKNSSRKTVKYAKEYLNISKEEGWNWGMIRAGMGTSSKLFVAQMQDVLELGADARMNTPGSAQGNWTWRMLPDAITPEITKKLRTYTERYGRL